jgi:hypothetical protein
MAIDVRRERSPAKKLLTDAYFTKLMPPLRETHIMPPLRETHIIGRLPEDFRQAIDEFSCFFDLPTMHTFRISMFGCEERRFLSHITSKSWYVISRDT